LFLSVGVALVCALFVEYPFVELARSTFKARNANAAVEASAHSPEETVEY